jgi:hypothetical protein
VVLVGDYYLKTILFLAFLIGFGIMISEERRAVIGLSLDWNFLGGNQKRFLCPL